MDILLAGLAELAQPLRFGMLLTGVLLGLMIGVIPGLGGLFGLTILIPITYSLDPVAAMALLLGMASVTTTSDTVPAVLLGVPGTVGSAATVLDGHEMARQGKAAQALGAAYTASLIGGLFGALMLTLALPVMRPVVLLLNYGDLLAITLAGLVLVALLTGGSWLRGLLAALLGVMVSLIGLDPYAGVERWTFGEFYFWGGIPVAILFLGLFGLSELASVLGRGRVARVAFSRDPGGLREGARLALHDWRLVLRSSAMGSFLGAVPGIGVTVIEWVAYGAASRNRCGGPEFGKGNIRGVIAPESANNAKEGGALLPTLAFGIPGSASMAILLGAFAIHGIVPGPQMLDTQAPLLVVMVLSVALANVIGALICLGMTPTLARIAQVPADLLVPAALVFVTLGAFYTNAQLLDIAVLAGFGALGVAFKRYGWSRPAFALGFVLGPNIERFFVLTYQISGWGWLGQPIVLAVLALVALGIAQALWRRDMAGRADVAPVPEGGEAAGPRRDLWFVLFVLAVLVGLLVTVWPLPLSARILPFLAGVPALGLALMLAAFGLHEVAAGPRLRRSAPSGPGGELRLAFLLASLVAAVLGLGHVWGVLVFLLLATAPHRPGRRLLSPALAAFFALVSHILFDRLAPRTWPEPWVFLAFG
jgi:putative tricarboxylic transport membrane protein